MSETVLLRSKVPDIRRRRRHLKRDAARHPHSVRFELLDLRGVVRHEAHGFHSEDSEDARGAFVSPQVCGEAEDAIRVHGVEAVILEVIGCDLVRDSNPATFLCEIQESRARGTPELLQGRVQLGAAVAPLRAKHVARNALGVQSDEHVFPPRNLSFHEGHMIVSGERALESMDSKCAVPGGESRGNREEDVVAKLDVRPWHGRRFAKTGAI